MQSNLGIGETDSTQRVIGVRQVHQDDEPLDTWWVSVIEADFVQDDRAVSSRHVVPLAIQPGVQFMRTISVEIAEAGVTGHANTAVLDFVVRAEVLVPNEPAPSLDVTLLAPDADPDIEHPTVTAGDCPAQFTAVAEGVGPSEVPVTAELVVELDRGAAGSNPREEALAGFLTHFSSDLGPFNFVPKIALYRISNPDGIEFFCSQNSSMGQRSQANIIEALNDAIPVEGGGSPTFDREDDAIVPNLLNSKLTVEFGPAATALAALIMELVDTQPERTTVARHLFTRETELDWFTQVWNDAFFVDPTPFSDPSPDIWLIMWSDAYEE
ncbi:MAG: hypothetical protein OEZ14_12640, partial [Acidimicrobiia bacterium]|nr:hypothetical protein [Acidimicrobiia bacterium]